jgi:hypothetical protein
MMDSMKSIGRRGSCWGCEKAQNQFSVPSSQIAVLSHRFIQQRSGQILCSAQDDKAVTWDGSEVGRK